MSSEPPSDHGGPVPRDVAAAALGRAVANGQLRLHYQPKVGAASGRITGAEALLRCDDPELRSIPPLELIGIAEEIGLIERLGTWVIEEACRQVADWHRRFPRVPPLVVSVNVSAHQLDPQLIETVSTALAAAGAGPQQLCLELTASASIGDFDVAVATFTRLRALGVRLSIDNFGTGYASLSVLQRLPVQELKIDRSYVRHVATEKNESPILWCMVSMAHSLGLSTVAVGVETAEQLEHLRRTGCEEVQGYLISRPKPAEELDPLLAGYPDIQ